MTAQKECIFCAIVDGRAPRPVADDGRTLAFLDIFPLTRGHTLVIPRRHCESLLDCPPEDPAPVGTMAQRVARATVDPAGLAADGVNLVQATGTVAFRPCSTSTFTCCRATTTTASGCRSSVTPASTRS